MGVGIAVSGSVSLEAQSETRPVVIASANGLAATERAMKLMGRGVDTLEAVVEGVGLVEADPEDTSVGYGGLPNERGVVQLDSSVMHGPTRGAAGVAGLENIVHAAKVARAVMENTDHVLLMGKGGFRVCPGHGLRRDQPADSTGTRSLVKVEAGGNTLPTMVARTGCTNALTDTSRKRKRS